jgi:hypothetical protein
MVSDLLPAEILTIIDAISTAVLAVITYFYAKETGLIRKTAQHPNFSLQPTLYTSESDGINRTDKSSSAMLTRLNLINNGLPANDIRLDCSWVENKSSKGSSVSVRKFYIMSLSNNGNSILNGVPIQDIINDGQHLIVSLTCKDTKGELYSTSFDMDFQTINSESRNVAYEYLRDFKPKE